MPEISPAAFAPTNDHARQSWADIAIPVTVFVDVHAREGRVHEQWITPRALAGMIGEARAREKARLPLLKLARFGNVLTARGSLRHDANVTAVTGVEADYDDEATSFDDACQAVRRAGVAAILYTSPSHSEMRPRCRVLCPFTVDGPETAGLPPAQRETMMRRLGGLFARSGAKLAPESWTLSQAYYYGGVVNGDGRGPRVELIEGATIDRCEGLDDAAVASPKEAPRAAMTKAVAALRSASAHAYAAKEGRSKDQSAICLKYPNFLKRGGSPGRLAGGEGVRRSILSAPLRASLARRQQTEKQGVFLRYTPQFLS